MIERKIFDILKLNFYEKKKKDKRKRKEEKTVFKII